MIGCGGCGGPYVSDSDSGVPWIVAFVFLFVILFGLHTENSEIVIMVLVSFVLFVSLGDEFVHQVRHGK